MPSRKFNDGGAGRAWAMSIAVAALAGCPGYLEDQAFTDGGRPVYTGNGGPTAVIVPAPIGAGGAVGTGGAVAQPPAASGGSSGGPKVGMDAGGSPDAGNAAALAACSSAAAISANILMPKCATCHKAVNPASGLDLASAGAKGRLLNAMARCPNKVLATDNPVAGGHLFDKLAGAVMGCGNRMPLNQPALSAMEILCLKAWIKPAAAPAPAPAPAGPPAAPGVVPCYAPAEVQAKILTPKCALCHGANMPAAGLDLATPGSKARMLGQPSKACVGKTLISPDATGHFFDKLAGAIPGCGNQMPFGGVLPLNAAEVQCLKDWIKPPVAQ